MKKHFITFMIILTLVITIRLLKIVHGDAMSEKKPSLQGYDLIFTVGEYIGSVEKQVFLADIFGNKEPRPLFPQKGIYLGPQLSPQGDRVSVLKADDMKFSLITGTDINQPFKTLFEQRSPIGEFYWSPSGDKIVFSVYLDGNYEICTISSSGENFKQLTKNSQNDVVPVWSPDGQRIAFATWSSSDFWEARLTGDCDIYIMNADGTEQKRITFSPETQKGDVLWSTDGKSLWYSNVLEMSDPGSKIRMGKRTLYCLNLDEGIERPMLGVQDSFSVSLYSIDMGGQRIAFLPDRQAKKIMV